MDQNNTVTLIGAGLTGSLLAIYLSRKGYDVNIFERRPDMRKEKISAGKSINLALSSRGLRALREVGLEDVIMENAIPMKGRVIHALDKSLTFQPYGRTKEQVINSVSRRLLNSVLMDNVEKLDKDKVKINFKRKCIGISFKDSLLRFEDSATSEIITVNTDGPIIGTDGSASVIRNEMINIPGFNLNQYFLDHGYKELTIPPGENNSFQIEKYGLHIWPRKQFMLIALPNPDGSFTCTLFNPFKGINSFSYLDSEEKVEKYFLKEFPDVIDLIPNLTKEFFTNPTGHLVTVKCFPWHVSDKALLIGDAAHAIVPFYGQGINAGFEDCRIFNGLLNNEEVSWEKLFIEYEHLRKPNTDAIADLAIDNFFEMRDKVADPKFLIKKKVEKLLEKKYSNFLSTYSRVTFNSDIQYSEAKRKGEIQDKILEEECYKVNNAEDIDLNSVIQKINKLMKNNG
ncbi:MAG: Kynurenine 3-monooxygenase [Candidatus Heimdallarchaeota archaeon LC_3]|nr:MAG: Kynurenine 3-monooxygenase [Candidatus Heimdallarchaeota archaeon LC_3]